MSKYHWQIAVPPTGPLNREQAWAGLASIVESLDRVLDRAGCKSYDHKPESEVTKEEGGEIGRHFYRLRDAIKLLDVNVLEKIAQAVVEAEKDKPSYPHAPEESELLDDYHGDLAVYLRNAEGRASPIQLAMLLLDQGGFEEDVVGEVLELLEKRQGRRDKCVFRCPRCDSVGHVGPTKGFMSRPGCKRCGVTGLVVQNEAPEEAEYDMSEEGKVALNEGKPWTPEQEAARQAELKAERDAEDEEA